MSKICCIFVSLVEHRPLYSVESLPGVNRICFDCIVIDSEASVRVSDAEVDGEIIVEIVVLGEVEGGERSIGGVDFDFLRADDEPEDEAVKEAAAAAGGASLSFCQNVQKIDIPTM
ncbi:hypothetical protein SOVF_158540 [Spinacia oleracea]|nr:hypothetical protein SOVF_158540 [Spinacia oleracea]